jgi:hypothetical protein
MRAYIKLLKEVRTAGKTNALTVSAASNTVYKLYQTALSNRDREGSVKYAEVNRSINQSINQSLGFIKFVESI